MRVKKKFIKVEYHSEGASLGTADAIVFVTEYGLYIDGDGIDTADVHHAKGFYPYQEDALLAFAEEHDLEIVEKF